MRVFRAVVEPTANLVAVDVADLFHRCGIRAKPVGDDAPRLAVFLHDALQKLERRSLVPLRGDYRFQNLAFVIAATEGYFTYIITTRRITSGEL